MIKNFLRYIFLYFKLIQGYFYDFKLYYKFSGTKAEDTAIKLAGKIIREYHVIEKGLTMPEIRLGFGENMILSLCCDCEKYIAIYGDGEEQVQHAVGVIFEYKRYHDEHNYSLDKEVIAAIGKLKIKAQQISESWQKNATKDEYFKYAEAPFHLFSSSRSSVRNYTSEEVPMEKIMSILKLSQNTPSVCNRQPWRTYVYADKNQIGKILEIQGGTRGFGHLANKLILITGELGVFAGTQERNQVFISGGMYTMNILFAFHYHKIAACCLNCGTSPKKDRQLRSLCKVKESEVFIAMVICGIPPEKFMITGSKRYDFTKTNMKIGD